VFNNLLFISSIFLVITCAWVFLRMGKSALISWIVFVGFIANLFVLKQIELFGFNATASDIFAVGGLFGLNLLQEYHGKSASQKAIWASFTCYVFFAIMSQIHLAYIPSGYDQTQAMYQSLLMHAPRIIIASIITAFIVQQFDSRFYGAIRKKLPHMPMIFASSMSILISQLLDTALFTVFGLYGIVSALMEIFIVSYIIKCLCIACLPFVASASKKLIKHD
jgi:uncharacterized integral membrane protein (TIGR00697 family)